MTKPTTILHTERMVLRTAMDRASSLPDLPLQPAHFVSEQHGDVWEAITHLAIDGHPTDGVSVANALEREGKNALAMLAVEISCTGDLYGVSNPGYYAGLLIDAWRSREAMAIAGELQRASKLREEGAVDQAITALMALHAEGRDCEHTAKSAMRAAWEQVEAAHQNGGALIGVPTGLETFDDLLGGLHDSDLIVIGARPAMGKTGLLLQMVLAASKTMPVGLISGEQPHEQVGLRWMAAGSRVSVGKLRAAKIEEGQWAGLAAAVSDIGSRNIRVYDRSGPDLAEVTRVARRWKHQHGIRALYVDYLQRIEFKSDAPKHERIGEIARGLKNLARNLQIPVIALAQVSRKVEERQNQRPTMSDLADSSEIEKEADQVITLWRDLSNPQAETAAAELIVCKNRHGNIGTVPCVWRGATTSFTDRAGGE